MATSIEKIYSITLKFSYEPEATITEDDLHVAELRTQIKEWIKTKVGSINKGNLSCHVVGDISES